MKLNKTKIYDLSELTSEERNELAEVTKNPYVAKNVEQSKYIVYSINQAHWQVGDNTNDEKTNAKELFYTLENVQVDCSELTEEQIKEMADVFENNGYTIGSLFLLKEYCFMKRKKIVKYCSVGKKDKTKTTITYEKFMELFGNKEKSEEFNNLVEVLNEELTEEAYKETSNKLNYELDFNFITQLAERMAQNKHKYEPYNWQKLDNIAELKQALYRHVMEVMKGNYEDDNRLFGHLESISLNAMFINYQLKKTQ